MLKKVTKGQNFRYGFYFVPAHDRLRAIKDAGFDETMFWWGTEYEQTDGSRLDLFDFSQKIGLQVTTCHFPSTHADWLWYDDERATQYISQFENACKECGERSIKFLVTHLTRKLITPEPNENGIANFAKMLESAQKYNVVIALENTRFLRYNDYILQHFSNPYIGFCFDCGHANCYTPNEKPLEKYGEMLVTTHIHDNIGAVGETPDLHHLMGEGIVNYDDVFARLKHFGAQHYNLESYCNETSRYFGKLDYKQYMSLSYEKLSAQLKKNGVE